MEKEKKVKVKEPKEHHPERTKKIINIIFIVVMAIILLVTIDLLCVMKFKVGPFLAVPTKVDDGGTQIYYGLGYKIIKYDQENGRKGTVVGFYTIPYSTNPYQISMMDLALQYGNNSKKTYKKFYDKYLQITGTIETIDNQNKNITLRYESKEDDEKGKYTLDLVVSLNDKDKDLSSYNKGDTITIRGSLASYKNKTDTTPNQLKIRDGFIQ